jgi:two-component SAPR family response regulator
MPRILVLEDDVIISLMMEDWLSDLACETVGPANSVAMALELIRSATPDAAILDLSLGTENTSGAVADVLLEKNVPFAFASGYGASALPARHRSTPVLQKPFVFEDVKRIVDRLLRPAGRPNAVADPHSPSAD